MITLSTSGNSVIFTFQDNQHYLQNGTIEVPKNSLSLVTDDSNFATFKKSASNDIFLSALYSELGMTKAELEAWFEENAIGSMGVDPEDVLDIVDENTNYIDGVDYVSSANTINFYHGEELVDSIDTSDFVIDGMIDDVRIETISGVSYLVIDFNTASGKEDIQIPLTDIFNPDNYYTKQQVDAALSGKADTSAVTADIAAAVSGKVDSSSLATVATSGDYDDLLNKPTIPTVPTDVSAFNNDAGYITENAISGKADTSAVTAVNNVLTAHTADTTIHVTSSDKSTWSGKQDALTAGRGININTGNTISFTLPISAGTGEHSIVEGEDTVADGYASHAEGGATSASGVASHAEGVTTKAKGYASHAEGDVTQANGYASHAEGFATIANNASEHASGRYNNSVSDSDSFGSSGNTLFSVGNGTNNAKHNAFEIRQNGDIYISKDGSDIKLQDNIGVGITSGEVETMISAATSGKADTSAVTAEIAAAVSGKVDTSAIVTAVTSASTDSQIPTAKAVFDAIPTGGGVNVVQTTGTSTTDVMSQDAVTTQLNNKANKSAAVGGYVFGALNNVDNIQLKSLTGGNIGNAIYYPTINGKSILTSNGTWAKNNYNFQLVETSAVTSAVTSASTDSEIPSAKAVYDAIGQGGGAASSAITSGDTNAVAGGAVYDKFDEVEQVTARALIDVNDKFDGLTLKQVTQAEYDALVSGGTVSNTTLYIITNVVS